jgi:hypothetical protein
MSVLKTLQRWLPVVAITIFMGVSGVQASDPDPSIMTFTLPDQIHWTKSPGGRGPETAILYGDPKKAGAIYVVLTKWPPHTMSRPHFHPNDRYISVIEGTWWVGWGTKYDPDSTYPMPKGSFVRHIAKKIHYDGAKDTECIIEIMGEGPDTVTAAEEK